jgi:GT2 family glycosyltransferase
MVDLSIIIVSWNAKEYLQKVSSQLLETNKFSKEIIVVDNASTDGSAELIKEKFQQVVLICNDANLGFAKANNIGIRQSRGKYVLLINSDVEVSEGCIERMADSWSNILKLGCLVRR